MVAEELTFGARMHCQSNITVGTLPGIGAILADVGLVGSSAVEIEKDII